jgi:hypothetical protein
VLLKENELEALTLSGYGYGRDENRHVNLNAALGKNLSLKKLSISNIEGEVALFAPGTLEEVACTLEANKSFEELNLPSSSRKRIRLDTDCPAS